VIYFIFIFSWGLNYNRKTAFEVFGYNKQEVTLEKLYIVGMDLKDSLNILAPVSSNAGARLIGWRVNDAVAS